MSSGSRVTGFWRQADLPTCCGTNPPAPVLTSLGNPSTSLAVPPGYQPRGQGPHSLAVPSEVGVPTLRAPPLSSQVLVTLASFPQPQESAPAHTVLLTVLTCAPFFAFLVLLHLFTQFPISNSLGLLK